MSKAHSPKIAKLLQRKAGVRVDLACGPRKQDPSFIGIDHRKLPGVDIVHDLEVFPWPLPSNCARDVVASHFLEHVKPWLFFKLMAEVHRICQPNAKVWIAGPYGVGIRWQQDPTHTRPLVEGTWAYFDPFMADGLLYRVYEPTVFHVIKCERVPAGGDTDINVVLQCCKPAKGKTCRHPR